MTQLRRIAITVSLVICANQVLAQDWKAQPDPQVTGQVEMNLLSDTWAVIGRIDKYFSAAAVAILEIDEKSVTIKMIEYCDILWL